MKRKILSTLALSIIIFGSSSTVYADNLKIESKYTITVSQNENTDCPKDKHGHKSKHKKFIVEFLKDKHKMTDKEIQAQLDSGKTFKDIMREKNIDHKELREYMLQRKYQKIDEAVKNGKLTKEEAEKKKQEIKKIINERQKNIEENRKEKKN